MTQLFVDDMDRHRGRVLGFFTRRLVCFEDAEEATQDVFLKLYKIGVYPLRCLSQTSPGRTWHT